MNNDGGGVGVTSGVLELENCFVGHASGATHAVRVDAGSNASINYSTVITGFNNFDDAYALQCTAPGTVAVRNSFLATLDNVAADIACAGATVSYSASQVLIAGTGNVDLPPIGAMWFIDVNTGDFRLDTPPAAFLTTAQWNTGDPPTDIEGDLRPTVDLTADVAGADLP